MPSILIAGATGNTGQGVVRTLSNLLSTGNALPNHQIIALTRSLQSPVAQQLAKLPGVQVLEQNWVEITPDWLKSHSVDRAFIASHLNTTQFAEESTFHVAALQAGVKYVVRISTNAPNVRPDCPAYYPRSHWAIETMLATPEFSAMQWTSLQANMFAPLCMFSAAQFVKQYRETGVQGTLKLPISRDVPVAMIDPDEIGVFAAHLLVLPDPSAHNKARYVVNGPVDTDGKEIVGWVEGYIGAKVESVSYEDMSDMSSSPMLEDLRKNNSPNVINSIQAAPLPLWAGECSVSTTSKAVLELAPPKRTPEQVLRDIFEA